MFARHTLKPFGKIIHGCAAFKILKERRHWNPRALEEPGTADLSWHALHRRAFAPIQQTFTRCSVLPTRNLIRRTRLCADVIDSNESKDTKTRQLLTAASASLGSGGNGAVLEHELRVQTTYAIYMAEAGTSPF